MKKLLMSGLVLGAIGLYVTTVNDPLNSLVSFIIAGVVPGTNIMLGMWPTIGVGLLALWLLVKVVRYVRLQMLEITAKEIKAEEEKQVFEAANQGEPAVRNHSVIAAPGSELVL